MCVGVNFQSLIKPCLFTSCVSDVANAIMDGADGLVLGSETLRGLFPVECVRTAAKIAQQAERAFDYRGNFDYLDAVRMVDCECLGLSPGTFLIHNSSHFHRSSSPQTGASFFLL